ncbi:Nucleolar GTP-binding protein 1 [Abeliophyllum distichum]|uniref:Nucleolar GTP-binding protein 1 n=1 Tax=Abeliophyllum distichum TaxID=126358 RepID=A0ABD1QKA6_9LAMI
MKSKKLNDYLNRFHVAMPKPHDQKERPPCIPEAVLEAKAKKTEQAAEKQIKLEKDLEYENGGAGGPKATASCSGVAVISKYCKGNSSVVQYPLKLKLIGLHIEDVSFATDQTERHLEVGNTGYGNYDSSAKRRLLVSLGIILRSYYKGGMLALLRGLLVRNAVVGQRRMVGRIWQDAIVVGTKLGNLLSIEYASSRPYVMHGHMGKLTKSGSTELENIDEDVHCE